MPIKLTTVHPEGGPVTKTIIQDMVDAYNNGLKKLGDEALKSKASKNQNKSQTSTNPEDGQVQKKCADGLQQTTCAWFSKHEIDELLKQNQGDGIRVYFGQHTQSSVPTTSPNYEDRLTIILVATIDIENPQKPKSNTSKDQLFSVSIGGPFIKQGEEHQGQGEDQFPLCCPNCPNDGMMKIIEKDKQIVK